MKSVLDKQVSCYRSYTDAHPIDVNIYAFINSRKYKDQIDEIRLIDDKKLRDAKKALLPAITPSGTFSYRNEAGLIKHSGLIQFDIDYKGNEHIDNFGDMTQEIGKLPFVAYCGYSTSGLGIWGLVPIAYPDKHKLHLQALKTIFKTYDLKMDNAPSNVASLRGYSYDDEAHINHNAEIFTYIHKQEPVKVYVSGNNSTIEQKFERAIKKTQERELFVDGSKHCFLVKLAGYCNAIGIDYYDCVELVEQNFRSLTESDVDLVKPISNVYKGYKQQHAEYAT